MKKGMTGLKVWKWLKILIVLVLVVSILGTDNSLILYANDSSGKTDVSSAILEGNVSDGSSEEQAGSSQEMETEDSSSGESTDEGVGEETAPEEKIPGDAVSGEMGEGEVTPEETLEETDPQANTEENPSEEETAIDEIADDFEVDLEARRSDRKGKLNDNYTHVCQGGGSEIPQEPYNKPNWNDNGMKNQDLGTDVKYYDPKNPDSGKTFSEKTWVSTVYAPPEWQKGMQRLNDAVIDPGRDSCHYGNPINGYGLRVNQTKNDRYEKYAANWEMILQWHGGTPSGIVKMGHGISTDYTGNYIYYSNNKRRKNPFTVVSHSQIQIEDRTNYYVRAAGSTRLPAIYDKTLGNYQPTNSASNTYFFKNEKGDVVSTNQYPETMGKYTLEAQYNPDKELFRLPEIATKQVNVLPKGYLVTFKMGTDKENARVMGDSDWDSAPPAVDSEVENMFGIKMYLENTTYQIPKPKLDETKNIFEGWIVYEEYLEKKVAENGFIDYEIKVREKVLPLNEDKTFYTYEVPTIGDNATYILDTELFAKYRPRKTFTAEVEAQTVDGSPIVSQEAISITTDPANNAAMLTEKGTAGQKDGAQLRVTHTYVEGREEATTFRASIKEEYGYEFVGWSEDGKTDYISTDRDNFKPKLEWEKQNEQDKTQKYTANFKAKPYRIVFNGNGGTFENGKTTDEQETTYYKDTVLKETQFERTGYRFSGWSRKESGPVELQTGDTVSNLPIRTQGDHTTNTSKDFPDKIDLYAVWEALPATVEIQKYKDTLWIDGKQEKAVSNGVYDDSNKSYDVYEIARYSLKVTTADNAPQEDLDPSKFRVQWERKKEGEADFTPIPENQTENFFTKPFKDKDAEKSGKVVYDPKKKEWVVPLLVNAEHPATYENINGIYRVTVAYEDPNAKDVNWKTSDLTEVKVVKTFDTVINIPATVLLVDKKKVEADGSTKEVIGSVYDSNEVTVKKVEHSLTHKEDYDWSTPNTAMDEPQTGASSYNSGQYEEYTKQKPLKVSLTWDGTLNDPTKSSSISDIKMYSARTIGQMKKGEEIQNGATASFAYGDLDQENVLFDFYLEGEKPNNLPNGTKYESVIHFKFENIGQ